ncbi:hypothetical protein [Bacteroides acidifaciens]|uniref:hypothetical protein n=1 Tax=Bacteroides acidifaciens TaxID=85831 RepID=UPI002432CC71|nr:hypothetical protein [Bacteroides acidifaciens]
MTERIYHLVDFTLLDKYFPGLFKPAKNSLTDSLCYNPVSAVSALFANALLEGDSGLPPRKGLTDKIMWASQQLVSLP